MGFFSTLNVSRVKSMSKNKVLDTFLNIQWLIYELKHTFVSSHCSFSTKYTTYQERVIDWFFSGMESICWFDHEEMAEFKKRLEIFSHNHCLTNCSFSSQPGYWSYETCEWFSTSFDDTINLWTQFKFIHSVSTLIVDLK